MANDDASSIPEIGLRQWTWMIALAAGLKPIEFAMEETDLEDVFMSLTEGKVQ